MSDSFLERGVRNRGQGGDRIKGQMNDSVYFDTRETISSRRQEGYVIDGGPATGPDYIAGL